MFTLFGKKKMEASKMANIFVNTIIETVEKGFPEIASLINESPEFVHCPNIQENDSDQFLMIVLAGNITEIPNHLNVHTDQKVIDEILNAASFTFGIEKTELTLLINDYKSFLAKVNFPSKNTLYSLSKGVFFKYNLSIYQDEYFKNLNSPNPLFLKRLDEAMEHFMWNWEGVTEKYTLV